jgi:hypothetical protein
MGFTSASAFMSLMENTVMVDTFFHRAAKSISTCGPQSKIAVNARAKTGSDFAEHYRCPIGTPRMEEGR